MNERQDRQGARTPADLERRYKFGQSFAEAMGLAEDAQKEAEDAKALASAAADAVNSLDQEAIFNLLTDNGKSQGLYRGEDGQLYINAQYILSGSFASTAEVFLDPGVEEFETIKAHVLGTATIPSDRIALYDFDNSGTVSINDMTICKSVVLGTESLAGWSGAVKSTVRVVIDASAATKAIKITGTNMWGREVEYSFGVDGLRLNGSSLANVIQRQIESLNPEMRFGVEYLTMERWNDKPVYTMLVDCGAMPNTGIKRVYFSNVACDIISLDCGGTFNGIHIGKGHPFLGSWDTEGDCICMRSSSDLSTTTNCWAVAKYIKK